MKRPWWLAKDREVMDAALPQALGNAEDSSPEPRAEEPAGVTGVPRLGATGKLEALGEPLSIREVALLIGCSVWTVRQRYVPSGLPHFRSSPNGKLLFYRNQVIRWLLSRQQKGGMGEPL